MASLSGSYFLADNETATPSHLGTGSIISSSRKFKRTKTQQSSEKVDAKVSNLRAILRNDVEIVLQTGSTTRSYTRIYQDVESLCLHKSSEQSDLAKCVFDAIDNHVASTVAPAIRQCFASYTPDSSTTAAQSFLERTGEFDQSLKLLQQLFLYLDRSYLLSHPKKLCIRPYGLSKLATELFIAKNEQVADNNEKSCRMVAKTLRDARAAGFDTDKSSLACALLQRFRSLSLASKLPAVDSLESVIAKDYGELSKQWLADDKSSYVILLLSTLCKEVELLNTASLEPTFSQKLLSRVIWSNLLVDLQLYLAPSLPNLCMPIYAQYLEMVKVFCDKSLEEYGADSNKMFLFIWGQHIQTLTERAIASPNVVQSILDLWHSIGKLCEQSLQENIYSFEARSSMSKVLGAAGVSVKLLVQLSKHCDIFMKSSHKPSTNFKDFHDDVLTIFKLIPNKSEFMKIYARDLSKRMLISRSFNTEMEDQFVESLIAVVGDTDDKTKVRAMFRDFKESQDAYANLRFNDSPELHFSAFVLEKKHWPNIPGTTLEVRLPDPLKATLENFASEYLKKSTRRKHHKLDWTNYALHQITLTVHFDKGPKDLVLNLLQSSVLMFFEDREETTYKELCQALKGEEKLLKRVVASMSTPKLPILLTDRDTIKFNHLFSDKSNTIRVPMLKEKPGSTRNEVEDIVSRERSSEIKATLVRTMKYEKTLPFAGLMGKCIEALEGSGKIAVSDLKTEIESLIVSEYIRRDDDGTTLHYIP